MKFLATKGLREGDVHYVSLVQYGDSVFVLVDGVEVVRLGSFREEPDLACFTVYRATLNDLKINIKE